MDVVLKVQFFFVFLLSTALADSNFGNGQDDKMRELIHEEAKQTQEVIKADMNRYFRILDKSLNSKLLSSELKILSEILKLREKVDANQNKLTQIERLIFNKSVMLNENVRKVESAILLEVWTQSEKIRTTNEEVLRSIANLTESINQIKTSGTTPTEMNCATAQPTPKEARTRVIVEEVSSNSGIIEFDGGANSAVKRKIWMLQRDEPNYISDARFLMEENNLGEGTHLTIWSDGGYFHLYNGSQGNWREERKARGHIILVTLTMQKSPSAGDTPKFKLRFNATRGTSGFNFYSSEVARDAGGVTTISFPKGNTQNYSPRSLFVAVVTRSDARRFALRLKQIDIPTRPGDCKGKLNVWLLRETPADTKYEKQPTSVVRGCGQAGNISELIGQASVAVVEFYSRGSEETGRGFRLEADISGTAE